MREPKMPVGPFYSSGEADRAWNNYLRDLERWKAQQPSQNRSGGSGGGQQGQSSGYPRFDSFQPRQGGSTRSGSSSGPPGSSYGQQSGNRGGSSGNAQVNSPLGPRGSPPSLNMPDRPRMGDYHGDAQSALAGSRGTAPSAYKPPKAPDSRRARRAVNSLGRPINLSQFERVSAGAAPDRIAGVPGLGPAPGRGMADDLSGRLSGGFQATPFDRVGMNGRTGGNPWERLALADARSGAGRDPGQQFQGRDIRREVFTEGDVAGLASRAAAPTIRAYQDAERELAKAGAMRGPGATAALRARAAIAGAGALGAGMRDARMQAAVANAQQEQAWADQARENFETDIGARLGLGNLSLGRMSAMGSFGTQYRGQDQARDIAGAQFGVEQRGQDISQQLAAGRLNADMLGKSLDAQLGLRSQDMGYAMEGGRQSLEQRSQDVGQRATDMQYGLGAAGLDVQQRAQDLEQQYRAAGLNAEQARARAQMEVGMRGQNMDFALGQGAQSLQARQQDIQNAQSNRQMDINQALGLAQVGLEQNQQALQQYGMELQAMTSKYGADVGTYQLHQKLEAEISMLNAQLQNAGLDRDSRMQIETNRQQLERELQANQLALQRQQLEQQASQFQQQLGQQGGQFDRNLAEQQRQFDVSAAQGQEDNNLQWAAFQNATGGNQPQFAGTFNPFGGWNFGGQSAPGMVPGGWMDQQRLMRQLEERLGIAA